MNSKAYTRRSFLKGAAAGAALVALPARSWARVLGANDRINVAVMGTNSRGAALAEAFATSKIGNVSWICDVERGALAKGVAAVQKVTGTAPQTEEDFRKVLGLKDVDALVIAAPDHWHTPASLLALEAGKHVYVEKPLSHNPLEGEMLVAAVKRTGKILQMGNQRRSWANVQRAMQELHDGVIGRVYYARAWYTNTRKPIGYGKDAPVPAGLNYELWQGPAPRRPFKDNLIHYNWHWFWNWGTGEACNNGTHELDVARWGMQVDYPTRVVSTGGRYHYKDDWETPDTQTIGLEFEGGKNIVWEGRSCNGRPVEGSGRGVIFYGEKGSMVTLGENAYAIYDLDNKLVREVKDELPAGVVIDTSGPGLRFDAYHTEDFLQAIRDNRPPTGGVETGHKSVLLCHLGNIAQRTGRALNCDTTNGHILNDPDAMQLWGRSYEKGWEPTVI